MSFESKEEELSAIMDELHRLLHPLEDRMEAMWKEAEMNCEACGHGSINHDWGAGLCWACLYVEGPCFPWEFR